MGSVCPGESAQSNLTAVPLPILPWSVHLHQGKHDICKHVTPQTYLHHVILLLTFPCIFQHRPVQNHAELASQLTELYWFVLEPASHHRTSQNRNQRWSSPQTCWFKFLPVSRATPLLIWL